MGQMIKHMPSFLKAISLGVLALITGLVALELGVRWRSADFSRSRPISPKDSIKILVVGDSITGWDSNSYATRMAEELVRFNPKISVINISKAAQRTQQVQTIWDQTLNSVRPTAVLIMLGKSDYINQKNSWTPAHIEFRDRLKSLSFLQVQWRQMRWEIFDSLYRLQGVYAAAQLGFTRDSTKIWTKLLSSANAKRGYEYTDILISQKWLGRELLPIWLERAAWAWANWRDQEALSILLEGSESDSVSKITDQIKAWPPDLQKLLVSLVINIFDTDGREDLTFQLAARLSQFNIHFQRLDEKLGWSFYKRNPRAFIDSFEKLLQTKPSYERGIRALTESYIQTKNYGRGIRYLTQLKSRSQIAELINIQIAGLMYLSGQRAQAIALMTQAKDKNGDDFYNLKGLLWLYYQEKNEAMVHKFFRAFGSTPTQVSYTRLTAQNYQELIRSALRSGSKVYALQYPSNSVEPLKRLVGPYRDRTKVVDCRSLLLENRGQSNLIDLFQNDFEHLTSKGAQILGIQLAKILENDLKSENAE